MHVFYLISVWIHILAATIWVGGMIFLALILVPVIRRPEYQGLSSDLFHWIGVRFRFIGWVCLVLLFLSGIFNLVYRGFGLVDLWNGQLWQGSFGYTLGIKLLFIAAVLILSALHDFVIGPRATVLGRANPTSLETIRLRRQSAWLGRFNLLLALFIVALGVVLVRG